MSNPFTIEKYIFEDDDQFTTVLNHPVQKDIKDMAALGMYVYMMSLPKDWKIIPGQLADHFGLHVDTIRKKLKYLIDLGYVFFGQGFEKGRFSKGRYLIFQRALDSRKREEIKKMFSNTEKPCASKLSPPETDNTNETGLHMKETTNPEPKAREESLSFFDKKQPYMKILNSEDIEPFMEYVEQHKHEANNLKAWLIDCAKKKYWLSAAPSIEEKIIRHKILADKIKSKYPLRKDIFVGYKYIEFINGANAPSTRVEFGENKYEKIFYDETAKRGLTV